MAQQHKEPEDRELRCNVRLAPILVTHTVILVVAIVWLLTILTG